MLPFNINQKYSHVILSSENEHDHDFPVILIEVNAGSEIKNTNFGNEKLGFNTLLNQAKQGLLLSVLPSDYLAKYHKKAYSGMDKDFFRSNACVQNCPHHIDNYKEQGVLKCYAKTLFDIAPKSRAVYTRQDFKFSIILPYEIRASYIGDVSKCSEHQQSKVLELIENSTENYCYTADHQNLSKALQPFFQVSATNINDCRYALNNGFKFYLSCSDEDKKKILPQLKKEYPNFNVHTCTTSIYSYSSCVTCVTKCNGKNNIVAITQNAKKMRKQQATKAKKTIRKRMKGFTHYHFIYDLLLMSLIAIRLKSLIIFWFYLFIVYFFDLVDFILSLFK